MAALRLTLYSQRGSEISMKTWIRNRQGNEHIASLDKPDGKAVVWIAPTREDPAKTIPSDRDDGYEQIVWHDIIHLVQSIDLEWERGEQ